MGLDDLLEGLLGRRRKHGYGERGRDQGYDDDYRDSNRRGPERVLVCTNCDAENLPSAKFCQGCGQPLRSGPVACAKCGADLPKGVRFCPECGTPQQP